MRGDLETLLDECIDRINEGESLEECLASYPEQAEELEPRLRAMLDIRDTLSTMPGATARAAARQRLDAAQVSLEKRRWKPRRRPLSLFGRSRRVFAPLAIALVLALVGFGLYGVFTPGLTPTVVAQDNFRLLLSDDASEVTAVGEFEAVMVTIEEIGFRKSGGPEVLIDTGEFDPGPYNLTDYLGPEAEAIWEGYLEPGDYNGAFIYVYNVTGTLKPEFGGTNINIPSGKLHLNIPFTVGYGTESDTGIDFVFDITIVKAGNSGQYIVKPVVKESGPDQQFVLHGAKKGKDDIEFKGIVSGVDPLVINIGDMTYELIVDENTKVNGVKGEFTEDYIGLTVRVEGILQEGNVVLISEIKVDNVEEDEDEIEFEGTISSIGPPLVIGGYTVNVDGDTVIEGIEGELNEDHVGLTARVEGILLEENVVLASTINVNNIEEDEGEIDFDGIISSTDPLVIGDYTVNIDEDTVIEGIEGELNEEHVGLTAMVEGTLQDGNVVLASKIKVYDKVNKLDAVIVITPYDVIYDGTAHTATGTATGVLGEPLSGLDLSGTTHTNASEYTGDTWTFTDSTGNYNNASGTVNNNIDKADAVIVITPYDVIYDGTAHTATGTATGVLGEPLSGLDLSGTTHTNAGDYTGDTWTFTDSTGKYNNTSGTVDNNINKAGAVIVVTPYDVIYDGTAHIATGTATGVLGEPLSWLDLSDTTHTKASDYTGDTWTFTDSTGNYNNASGTVNNNIDKADAVIVVTPYDVIYDGTAHTATGTATGVLGEPLSGLDLSGTTHTDAGNYTGDPWTFTDSTGNYNNAGGTVNDNIHEPYIEFEGTISSIVPLVIGDYTVIVDEHTVIAGIGGEINEDHVDLIARVEGELQEGNVVLASKIKVYRR